MSEQMFGIKVNGGIVDAAPSADEATDKAIIFYSRHHQHPWQIVPVRIVEDAGPCEWEKKCAWDGMPVEYNEAEQRLKKIKCSDWLEYQGFNFCPNCGRILGGVK